MGGTEAFRCQTLPSDLLCLMRQHLVPSNVKLSSQCLPSVDKCVRSLYYPQHMSDLCLRVEILYVGQRKWRTAALACSDG